MSKNKLNRSWWRGHFIDHPGFAEGGPGSFVESYTQNTKATKVYCAVCLPVDIERIIQDDLHVINQGRITAVRDDAEIQTYRELIKQFNSTGLTFILPFCSVEQATDD